MITGRSEGARANPVLPGWIESWAPTSFRSPAAVRGFGMSALGGLLCDPGVMANHDADYAPCLATFREEPMPDTVYCQEDGYHTRHTSGGGNDYYTWFDGDEGAGSDPEI